MDRRHLANGTFMLVAGIAMTFAAVQSAAAADRVRVRGIIESLDGDTLKVRTREGKDMMVMLKSGWGVTGVVKASATDIRPGDFVGIASQPTDSGINGALEVVVFPAAMKGTGEGDRPWDLKPNSSMTNATVANAVTSVDGPTLTLAFQGKEKKIKISDGTPVVTFGPANRDDVKAGATVFINGDSAGDGMVSADRVVVGTNGVVPPM